MFEACCHAMLSGIAGVVGSGITAVRRSDSRQSERWTSSAGSVAAGYRGPALRTEPAFNPLRARHDFQLLMMDLAMPGDPFAPSP